MRSIKRRFIKVSKKHTYYSSHTCYLLTVENQDFNRAILHKWFNKLVEKDDYDKKDKKQIMKYVEYINLPDQIQKQTSFNDYRSLIAKDVKS